jgi:hypothetical protein
MDTGKGAEGRNSGHLEALSQQVHEGTGKNRKEIQDRRFPERGSNPEVPKEERRAMKTLLLKGSVLGFDPLRREFEFLPGYACVVLSSIILLEAINQVLPLPSSPIKMKQFQAAQP